MGLQRNFMKIAANKINDTSFRNSSEPRWIRKKKRQNLLILGYVVIVCLLLIQYVGGNSRT